MKGACPLVGAIEVVNPAGAFTDNPMGCEKLPDTVTETEIVSVPPCGIVVVDGLAVKE